MNLAPYIVAGVLTLGFGAGWVSARVQGVDQGATAMASLDNLHHGGALAANVVNRWQTLGVVAEPVVDEASGAPAPPPPPDIAVLFRRDLTAIETTPDGGRFVWVVDVMEPRLRRKIARGQVYRDGWRVNAISDQTIELRRRRERREIAVFSAPNMVSEP
ncbi:hypothetical protein U91I_01935 [alpha proteobacterium U9-1i]|nr:hypothetical protein U91I_01935 [alpha proteobacterium U9-1i]